MVALLAVIGLIMGHFLGISLDRFYSDQRLSKPLLRCTRCSARLSGAYLLPVLGYVWLRGRCQICGAGLPFRALLLPFGGAASFALAYLALDEVGAALLGGFFCTLYLALVFTDLERRLIPNRIVYPGIFLAIIFAWGWPDRGVASIFAGGAVSFAVSFVIYLIARGGFGMGDVKMLTLMGFSSGFPYFFPGLIIASFAAGLLAAILLLLKLTRRGSYIPYGPFIALGAVISTLWGPAICDWYRG
ncbi:MAG TPA: A24 family peptidase [Dehalococcoidia bacterium]|nr:A24 family peptidase [Dehalococcoidia bacterium]